MHDAELNISELAVAAGLSRRAVRFYVQQGLLAPPEGRGRGSHYRPEHLARLKRIVELQQAGHSLDAIRMILEGRPAPTASAPPQRLYRPRVSAELWTRLKLMDGVELHFNAARFSPEVERLLELRDLVRQVFAASNEEADAEAAAADAPAISESQAKSYQEPT